MGRVGGEGVWVVRVGKVCDSCEWGRCVGRAGGEGAWVVGRAGGEGAWVGCGAWLIWRIKDTLIHADVSAASTSKDSHYIVEVISAHL